VKTRTRRRRKDAPEKSLSHHREAEIVKKIFPKRHLVDTYFFKNNILSSSLQKRAQQNTTHHPLEKKKKRAKYTRLPLTTHRYYRRRFFRYQ